MTFDTANTDVLLPSTKCDKSCDGHTLYDASASTTSIDLETTFQFDTLGDNTIRGDVYTDDVNVGGYTVSSWHVYADY